LKIEQNDTIAIVDGRPELTFIKGQNQRTFEIGTFPRNILEVLRFNRNGTLNTISRPVQGTLQHMAHGSVGAGSSWGSPAFLDSTYNNNNNNGGVVQMRQKTGEHVSKNTRQQKAISEHFAKERKTTASKQFSYNKLVNEHRIQNEYQMQKNQIVQRAKPARPPAPQVQTEGILIDLSPDEIRSMNINLQTQKKATNVTTTMHNQQQPNVCLLDEPIDIPTEHLMLDEPQNNLQSFARANPPAYNMPPQYLNSSAINDPFETNHVLPALQMAPALENLYANSSPSLSMSSAIDRSQPIYNNNDAMNELLNVNMSTLSIGGSSQQLQLENVNGQPVTPKKVEKQMLSQQLHAGNNNSNGSNVSISKENSQVSVNLEQMMNAMHVPMTPRNYDSFTPNPPQNGNYSNAPASASTYGVTNTNAIMNDRNYDANIYNSVAGDSVYSESFYDAVASHTPSVIYDSTASIYGMSVAQQQQAIYDEVATYEEIGRWRPQMAALRQAPLPPQQISSTSSSVTSSPMLSQQQINRRMEKINQQYGRVAELMNKLSMDNMTEDEAKEALEATNWNQDLATRHFKIERLAKCEN
jgi:hypothetical protein